MTLENLARKKDGSLKIRRKMKIKNGCWNLFSSTEGDGTNDF